MHRKHLIPCAVMLALAVLVAGVWGVQSRSLALVAAMLLCPAAMLFMMRGMATADHRDADAVAEADSQRGPNEDLRGDGRPFRSAVDVPGDAPITDRLVAWLGRQP